MSILAISRPDPALCGGVSSIWNVLAPAFQGTAAFVVVGRRRAELGRLGRMFRLGADTVAWAKAVGACRRCIINTSLQTGAIPRDALLVLLARIRGLRILVFLHGWDDAAHAWVLRNRWRTALFRALFLRGTTVVVLANRFRNELLSIEPTANVTVGSIVVANDWLETPISEARRSNAISLLYISRIDRDKGLRETLEALSVLAARGFEPHLSIAGDGPALAEMKAYSQRLNLRRVTWCGLVAGQEKMDVFESASILVFPTHYGEGLPVVVAEAMSRGLAIITTAVGGLADIFLDGRMGVRVPTQNAPAVADAIERLIADPLLLRTMSEFNRSAAQSMFSAGSLTSRLLALTE